MGDQVLASFRNPLILLITIGFTLIHFLVLILILILILIFYISSRSIFKDHSLKNRIPHSMGGRSLFRFFFASRTAHQGRWGRIVGGVRERFRRFGKLTRLWLGIGDSGRSFFYNGGCRDGSRKC